MHRIYKNISLINKARKLLIGTDEVIAKMKHKNLYIFISTSASINTYKLIQNKQQTYGGKIILLDDTKKELAEIFNQKQIKVIGISDYQMKKMILKDIKGE